MAADKAAELRTYLDDVLEQMAAGRMGNGQYRLCFAGGYMDDSSRFIYEIYDDAGETISRISRMDDMADSKVLKELGGTESKSNRLALGLSDNLDEFAITNNAHTWKDFSDPINWKEGVNDALFDPDMQILVNLDGVDNPMLAAQRAASNIGGATDWELLQIELTPSAWDRITWYKQGEIVSNSFE